MVECRVVSVHEDIERRATERVGMVLRGKYQLDALLGVGGMGAVYAATHKNNRSRVAVKVLHAEQSVNAHIRQRFLREGYVANTVDHVGAVRVIDDDTAEDGAVFLVMELLEGETLEARLRRRGGKLPEAEVAEIAVHLLDVLAAAHAKKIVHRDMKPENVFITKANVVKVLDFGIARLREEGGATTSTQTGQTVGTPAFMAPEQAMGDPDAVGPETDVWAIGATMFTALSGELVHEDATTPMQMVLKAATKKARSVATAAPETSSVLSSIVDRALAFDRKDRYPDAGAMRDALREGLGISIVSSAPNLPRISSPEFAPTSHISDEALAPTIALPEKVVGTTTAGLSAVGRTSKAPSRARLAVPIGLGIAVICGVAFFALKRNGPRDEIRPQPITTTAAPSTPAVETPAASTPAMESVAPLATSSPVPLRSAAPQLRAAHSSTKPAASASASASAAPSGKSADPFDRQ
jgi:serine/threonine-protein kinase